MRCLPLSCSAPLARLPWRCWVTNRLIPRNHGDRGLQPRLGAMEKGFSVFFTNPCPVLSNLGQITVTALVECPAPTWRVCLPVSAQTLCARRGRQGEHVEPAFQERQAVCCERQMTRPRSWSQREGRAVTHTSLLILGSRLLL